jgi:hypothetical protein
VIWYGPYTWLLTGNYTVTFRIKTQSENLKLTIDVCASEFNLTTRTWSLNPIRNKTLNFSDFEALGKWQEFTLDFRIEGLKRMEFRGMCELNNVYVALDYIKLTQLGP